MNKKTSFDLADALNRPDEDFDDYNPQEVVYIEKSPLVNEIQEILLHLGESGKVPDPTQH